MYVYIHMLHAKLLKSHVLVYILCRDTHTHTQTYTYTHKYRFLTLHGAICDVYMSRQILSQKYLHR